MTRLAQADPRERLRGLIGKRVRAVITNTGSSKRVLHNGDPIEVPCRLVVTGEVVGWEIHSWGGSFVEIAGYGQVPVECVKPLRWWQ